MKLERNMNEEVRTKYGRALPHCQLPETQHMLQNIGTINEPLPSPQKIEPIVTKAYFVWFLLITGLRLHHLPFFFAQCLLCNTAAHGRAAVNFTELTTPDCSYSASPQTAATTQVCGLQLWRKSPGQPSYKVTSPPRKHRSGAGRLK